MMQTLLTEGDVIHFELACLFVCFSKVPYIAVVESFFFFFEANASLYRKEPKMCFYIHVSVHRDLGAVFERV
jgi:hypothetical protein